MLKIKPGGGTVLLASVLILFSLCSCQVKQPSPKTSDIEILSLPKPDLAKAAKLNLQLALDYLKENHLTLAKAKLLLVEQQAPNSPRLYTLKGYYYTLTGDVKAAHRAYQKALDLSPNNPGILNSVGVFQCRVGRYHDGIKNLLAAINNPKYNQDGLAYQNVGICAYNQKKYTNAQHYFREAIKHNPDLVSSYFYLAKVSFQLQAYQEAKRYIVDFEQRTSPTKASLTLKKKINEVLS